VSDVGSTPWSTTPGLDEHRARDWVVVRMLNNACWHLQDPPEVQQLTSSEEYLTMCIAVAKAVQD
jgi:streptomycin 6-kinase